jgi:hypothetical protein
MKHKKMVSILVMSLIMAGISHAAPFSQTFRNDYQTDSMYLFITEGNAAFTQLQRAPRNWDIGLNEPDMLSIYGPVINPGHRFRVKFSDRETFTLEWAELLNGNVMGSGSLFAVDGRFVDDNNVFSSQSRLPTPITSSLWLLESGMLFLLCFSRNVKK